MPWDEEQGEEEPQGSKGKLSKYMGAALSAMGGLSYRKDKSAGDGSSTPRTPRDKKAKDADTPSRKAKAVDAGKEVLAKAKKAKDATLAGVGTAVAKAAELKSKVAEERAKKKKAKEEKKKAKEEKEAIAKKDSSKKDSSKKDTSKKDTSKKESTKKEPAKKETTKKDDAPKTPWSCAMCTLENEFGVKECEVCGTPNPNYKKPEAKTSSKTDKASSSKADKAASGSGLGFGRMSKAIKGGA